MKPCCACCDGPLAVRNEAAHRASSVILAHCPRCGSWAAEHRGAETAADVWVGATVSPAYLAALLDRRRRQALAIAAALAPFLDGGRVLDYGCGYGLFLDVLLAGGMDAWGCELSPTAIERAPAQVRDRIRLVSAPWAMPAEPYQVVCLLDVLEHCDAPAALLGRIRAAGAVTLVIKVPLADGPLFQLAAALARLGRHGPLEHLFLAGEHAPHLSYFSARGLARLLELSGYRTVRRFGIAEVGPELQVRLRGGTPAANGLAAAATGLAGQALEWIAPLWSDTGVFIAKAGSGRGSRVETWVGGEPASPTPAPSATAASRTAS